ncbi:hypothetical protein [Hymenobacter mucosus]|uniref:Uncharacterized protein n=1 Tax=Hymenobacter mucosus TaxID=1411120 RepID=A0A239A1H1_9BACT|nr:hypothetical protein [Hymenobacter mucosus]SNR89507.1 hypothetical protein SAMN06269173_110134 [Hymenobacter mucosus]
MKKISRNQKGERRANNVDYLLDGAELPYGQNISKKRPGSRAGKSSKSSMSADSDAEQSSSK